MRQELRNSASGFALRQRKKASNHTIDFVSSTKYILLWPDLGHFWDETPGASDIQLFFQPLLQAVVDHALKTRNVELVSFTSAVSSRAKIAGSKRQQMGISCEYTMNIL